MGAGRGRVSIRPMPPRHASEDRFYHWDGDTLVLSILGKPGAPRDAIGKLHGRELKVSVTATPEAGRATDHMLRFLAKEFGVAPRDVELVFGRESVHKQVRVRAPTRLPAVFGDPTAGTTPRRPG